jgi:hypothetical protein
MFEKKNAIFIGEIILEEFESTQFPILCRESWIAYNK